MMMTRRPHRPHVRQSSPRRLSRMPVSQSAKQVCPHCIVQVHGRVVVMHVDTTLRLGECHVTIYTRGSDLLAGQAPTGSRDGDSSPISSGVALSTAAQPSDEEPATASDSSSGADPWTVVTSPSRRTAPSLPAAVPEAAAEAAAEPGDDKQPVDDVHAQSPGDGGVEAGGTAAAAGSTSPAAENEQSAPSAQPSAPSQDSAAAPPAAPAMPSPPQRTITDDNDDDDLGDIEAAPNDDGDDEVDEDWGYEST